MSADVIRLIVSRLVLTCAADISHFSFAILTPVTTHNKCGKLYPDCIVFVDIDWGLTPFSTTITFDDNDDSTGKNFQGYQFARIFLPAHCILFHTTIVLVILDNESRLHIIIYYILSYRTHFVHMFLLLQFNFANCQKEIT